MEHKFRTLQRRMRLLFEDAPIGVAFTNLKREVVDANNYLARLSKKPKEELSGISLEKLLEEDDYKDLNSKLSEIQSGEQKSFIMEVRLKNPNNKKASKESVVTLYANPMLKYVSDIDIETEGFVLHFLDKTDQKQLEEQFAQAQKMQAMGKIAGSVAHDFNNILTAIIGFCDFLKQRHGPRDPSFPDITQISDNAHRAAKLASKLLAFSRTQPMRPRVVNVTDTFVDRIYTFLRGLIGDTIDIDMVHGKDVGYIRVDLMQLELVFMNLATNARDAMPSGGTITISTKVKKFDEPIQNVNDIIPDGEFVAIKFKDSGEGIPKENIEHIFEPFFTTKKDKQSGRTANSGTGLGLSMVYGTVKQMGGFIEVESTVGEGTAFIIYLPRFSSIPKEEIIKVEKSDDSESIIKVKREIDIEEQEQLSIPLDMPETEQQNGEKDAPTELSGSGVILFVEDEPAVRAFGTRALRDKGYDVMESDCGESALEMLEEKGIEKIDLLVTDMMMPGIDGVTLAKKLKSRIEGLKVILISGYSEDIARDDLADSPDFHFLAKPFSLKEFATEVKRVIDNE
jgi:two-component system cell cycle sensor histidine kinase/response regulator CckA